MCCCSALLEHGLVPKRWQLKDPSVTRLQCGCPYVPQRTLLVAGEMSPPCQRSLDLPALGGWCLVAAEHIWVPEPPVGAWPEQGLGLLPGN